MTRLGGQRFGIAARAVDAYARHAKLPAHEARAELAELLADAAQQADPDLWRARSKTTGLDITARTVHDTERGHLVVIGVSVREERQRRPGRDGRAAPSTIAVVVELTAADHATIAAELRGGETVSSVLRASGLATARARARARGRS